MENYSTSQLRLTNYCNHTINYNAINNSTLKKCFLFCNYASTLEKLAHKLHAFFEVVTIKLFFPATITITILTVLTLHNVLGKRRMTSSFFVTPTQLLTDKIINRITKCNYLYSAAEFVSLKENDKQISTNNRKLLMLRIVFLDNVVE